MLNVVLERGAARFGVVGLGRERLAHEIVGTVGPVFAAEVLQFVDAGALRARRVGRARQLRARGRDAVRAFAQELALELRLGRVGVDVRLPATRKKGWPVKSAFCTGRFFESAGVLTKIRSNRLRASGARRGRGTAPSTRPWSG